MIVEKNQPSEPFVSIMIINFNGLNHLEECLNSLLNLNYKSYEIIVVDNKSQDNSVDFIKKNFPTVKIIQLNNNYGFAKANNIAAKRCRGKYLVLLNFDTKVDKNWLNELVETAESSKDFGIIASKIYYYNNPQIINYAGSCADKYGKVEHIGGNIKDHKLINVRRKTFYPCGASFLIKREIFEKIGLFDSSYFAYGEDFDLGWRSWLFGYKVIYEPKSFIYHKIGVVMGSFSEKKLFYSERNELRTFLKNYELKTMFKIFPVYIGRRIGMIIRFSLRLKTLAIQYLLSYIKAIIWNLFLMKSLISNRKFIQSYRTKDDDFILKLMENTVMLKKALQ